MKKNYYDILEINKNASQEIVEKAYKTLAKKYHPDLQEDGLKIEYEEKLKLINEAYDVISDTQKRSQYDLELLEEENLNNSSSEPIHENPKNNINNNKDDSSSKPIHDESIFNKELELKQKKIAKEQVRLAELERLRYEQELQQARQQAYQDAYIQDLKNRGYKIKYKKSFKDYLKGFISIILLIFVFIILWQIPFIQNYFIDLYNTNEIIHYFINIFQYLFNL